MKKPKQERPGDWYRGVAESYERYADRSDLSERARSANLLEGAKYRSIGARVDAVLKEKR